jgi:hypothetical protein
MAKRMKRDIDWANHAVELALVVVGILIALGIDNWHTEQQERRSENRVLGQLHQDLARDLEAINEIMAEREASIAAMAELRGMIEGAPFDEALFSLAVARAATLQRFAFRRGAYEVIKSGAVRLADEDLRIRLSDYYEYDTVLANQSIEDIEFSFLSFWLPFVREYAREWRYNDYFFAHDPRAMLADPMFRQLLVTDNDNNTALIRRLKPLAEQMRDLLDRIEASRGNSSRNP